MDIKDIDELIQAHGIRTVIVAGVDPYGILRGKRMTVRHFRDAVDAGVFFASFFFASNTIDEVIPGPKITGFETGIPDIKGVIDLASFRLATWEPATAMVMLDWRLADGTPTRLCPRSELKHHVARARALGLDPSFALELEFYLLPTPIEALRKGAWHTLEPASRHFHTYSIYEGAFWEPVVAEIRGHFDEQVESCLPEWGPGQFEINLRHDDAVRMADTAAIFKTAVRQIAARKGLSCTFMAKWNENYSGSSGHVHQSLWTRERTNAFFDPSAPDRMSDTFRHYLAGQMDVFRPTALFLAPTVNSYKRLQPDTLAGFNNAWGIDNRTGSFRAITLDARKCRLESRLPGADINPYVAFAALLSSGLRGMERKMPLAPACVGNAYASGAEIAPRSLAEAVASTEACAAIGDVLYPELVENLIFLARHEVAEFNRKVTDLELSRYFEMV
jgi:glutamine synthetase